MQNSRTCKYKQHLLLTRCYQSKTKKIIKTDHKYCLSTGNSDFTELVAEIQNYEMAEIRLDMCDLISTDIINLFSSHPNLIATFRRKENISDKKRIENLKLAIESGAKYIDLDYPGDIVMLTELQHAIHENMTKLIVSYHDHEKTPSDEFIEEIISKIASYKPFLIKLAFMSNSEEDNLRVLQLYSRYENLLAFNMGEKGKITRLTSLKHGAPFAYVCKMGEMTAKGQMSLEEMKLYSRKDII